MVKRKGTTKNTSVAGRGDKAEFKCPICSRRYVMKWTLENHIKKCKLGKDFIPKKKKDGK